MNQLKKAFFVLIILLVVIIQSAPASAEWIKLDPPPDIDKEFNSDATCWLATAANMLAGAGYGYSSPDPSTVQSRAEHIYEQMKDYFGKYT